MKRNIKNIGILAFAALALTACSDVVDYEVPDRFSSNGAPVINSIYDIQDDTTPIEGGKLNQIIHIKGANLSHVKKITFNGVEVKEVYAESEDSYVKIPRVIPEEINNLMVYETEQGTLTYQFPVTIPSVEIVGLMNEFTLQGNSAQINGDNFDLYGFNDTTETSPASIVIANEKLGYREEIHADSCTESFTSIFIPEDCPDNSLITFSWEEVDGRHTKTISYRMTDELMYGNFDADLGWWSDFGKEAVTDGTHSGDPQSLGYNFLRFVGTWEPWSWNGTGFGSNWRWPDASAHPENYYVKFEVCTAASTPFKDYGNNDMYHEKNGGWLMTLNGGSPRVQFDPVAEWGLLNTYGEWVTVRMPLDRMLSVNDTPLPSEPDQWVNLEFVCQPNTDAAWNVDCSFGQFRIEPMNY